MFRRPARSQAQTIEHHAALVEQTLLTLGVDVDQSRLPTENGYGWRFSRGSAAIEVYLAMNEGIGFLQVLAPLLHLPMNNLLAFYRHLLELNLSLTGAAFGIHHEVVYLFSERPVEGLDPEEVNHLIDTVAAFADDLDDKLVGEFGGRLYKRI